jgi:hypothetical protein
MSFAFGDLLADIGTWLILGVVLAGIITVFVTPGFIDAYLGDGLLSMLAMTVLATPLYVCATASTPIAAALALKGLSPGAALVFLLAGPATNAATLTLVSRLLGRRTAAIYLAAIVVCSMALGMLTNALYKALGLDLARWVSTGATESHGWVSAALAILLLGLILRPLPGKLLKRFFPDCGTPEEKSVLPLKKGCRVHTSAPGPDRAESVHAHGKESAPGPEAKSACRPGHQGGSRLY